MALIIVDVYEPQYLADMLSTLLQVHRRNLVQMGMCDYLWYARDGHSVTVERKTWSDLISNIKRLEVQLRTATQHADEVCILVEGVCDPLAGCESGLYDKGKDGKWFRRHKISEFRYDALEAFLYQVDKLGITVYRSASLEATVWMLKTFVENSQKPDFSTLKRYNRTRPVLWAPNPVIETFMGVRDKEGAVLGEKRAAVMAKMFGSLFEASLQSPENITMVCEGIGIGMAKRFLAAVRTKVTESEA